MAQSHASCKAVACVLTVVLAVLVLQTSAHVVMIAPKSRAWYDYLLNYNYNPHAVFAGGKQ